MWNEPKTQNDLGSQKVTIYRRSEFGVGFVRIEAKGVIHGTRKYAQYDHAVFVQYRAKRKRRDRVIHDTFQPSAVIVAGWNHPDFEAWKTLESGNKMSLYRSCDSQWDTDFAAWLASQGFEILADYRSHNSHSGEKAA